MKQMRTFRITALVFLVFSLLFAASGTVAAQSKKEQKQAKNLAEQAEKSYDQKNFRLAVDQFAQSLAIVATNPDAHFTKGMSHHLLKEDDQALSEFDTALKQGFKRPLDVYLVRWEIYAAKNNMDAALADLTQALALDPQNPKLLLALGNFNLDKGSFDNAAEAYQKASLRLPNNPEPYLGIAKAKYALGDDASGQLAAAENALKRGTQNYGEAHFLMGDALQKLGKIDEALESYKKAITADVNTFDAYTNMGEIYRAAGRYDEAIDITRKGLAAVNLKMEQVTKSSPAQPEQLEVLKTKAAALYTDASWYYSLGDHPEDAVQSALAAIRLRSDEAAAHTNLCRAYNDLNKPEMAVTACNNAIKIAPGDGETLFYLGRAYDMAGRKADATRAYKGAVIGLVEFTQKNPTYSDGFYLLGNAYYSDNQPEKAIAAYQKCLELSPRFARARFNLGYILNNQKNKTAALEQYNSLLQLDPTLAAKLKAEIDK